MFIFKSTVKFKLFAVDKKEKVLKIAIFRKVLVLKMREMENILKKNRLQVPFLLSTRLKKPYKEKVKFTLKIPGLTTMTTFSFSLCSTVIIIRDLSSPRFDA